MKAKIIAVIIFLFTLFFGVQSFRLYLNEHKTNKRLLYNARVLNQQVTYYQTATGRQAARIATVEYTLKELKATINPVLAEIQNLKVKPGRVEVYTNTVTEAEKHITTRLNDSTVYDTVPVKTIHYTDPWYRIAGIIRSDSAQLSIKSADTITTLIYRGKRPRPWLWLFSPRRLKTVTTNSNPYNKIVTGQTIIIKK